MYPFQHFVKIFAAGQLAVLYDNRFDFPLSCQRTVGGSVDILFKDQLYAFLIYSIIKVALSCDNPFGCFICTGIAAMFIIQIIENIGMCLGIMPVIGITLPFLSYGGSSALSTSIAIGMVLSVGTHKERNFFKS